MPTKFQSATGSISPMPTAEAKFPIYFCEECGAPNAAFGIVKLDGRLNFCGWEGERPVCIGKGKERGNGQPEISPPWESVT